MNTFFYLFLSVVEDRANLVCPRRKLYRGILCCIVSHIELLGMHALTNKCVAQLAFWFISQILPHLKSLTDVESRLSYTREAGKVMIATLDFNLPNVIGFQDIILKYLQRIVNQNKT